LLHSLPDWLILSITNVVLQLMHACLSRAEKTTRQAERKREEKTMPFGVNIMRSQVLYRAAQAQGKPVTTAIPAEEPKGMQGQAKSLVLAENKCLKQ